MRLIVVVVVKWLKNRLSQTIRQICLNSLLLYSPTLRAGSSTGSSENSTPTAVAIAVKDDEVDSGKAIVNSSKSSQRFIQGFNRLATLLTLMLKTTGSSKVSAPRVFGADDDEVVGGVVVELMKRSKNRQRPKSLTFGTIYLPKLRS